MNRPFVFLLALTTLTTLGLGEEYRAAKPEARTRPAADLRKDWSSRLRYVGVVLEEPDYHIWGSSPIWGNDGKVHLFSSRIPKATGFYKWWGTSQIAHYVAERPEGPFKLVEVLLKPGQSAPGAWDTGTQHNPTITRIGDRYVLLYHSSTSTAERRMRPSERIGMMTATDINGPWTKVGKILDPPTAKESREVPPTYNGNADNPSLVRHPDGRFFLYYRIKHRELEGHCTYGVAIADKLEGPYVHHPTRVVNNPTYIEDPYVFFLGGLFYMLITDNENHRGLLLASKDGLHFEYHQGHGFGTIADYIPAEKLPPDSSNVPRGVFERPQLLFKNGVPTHLYVPCRTAIKGGNGACCYLFAIDAP